MNQRAFGSRPVWSRPRAQQPMTQESSSTSTIPLELRCSIPQTPEEAYDTRPLSATLVESRVFIADAVIEESNNRTIIEGQNNDNITTSIPQSRYQTRCIKTGGVRGVHIALIVVLLVAVFAIGFGVGAFVRRPH